MRAIEEAFLKIGIAGAILLVMFKFGEIVLRIFGKDKNSQNNQIDKIIEANQQQSNQLIEAIINSNNKGMEEVTESVKIQSNEIKNMAVAIGELAIAITNRNKIEENNRNYIQEKFAGVDSKLEAIIKEINKISKDTAFISERTEFCMNSGGAKNGNNSR